MHGINVPYMLSVILEMMNMQGCAALAWITAFSASVTVSLEDLPTIILPARVFILGLESVEDLILVVSVFPGETLSLISHPKFNRAALMHSPIHRPTSRASIMATLHYVHNHFTRLNGFSTLHSGYPLRFSELAV